MTRVTTPFYTLYTLVHSYKRFKTVGFHARSSFVYNREPIMQKCVMRPCIIRSDQSGSSMIHKGRTSKFINFSCLSRFSSQTIFTVLSFGTHLSFLFFLLLQFLSHLESKRAIKPPPSHNLSTEEIQENTRMQSW